jgi:hypothetical protein
MPVEAREEVRKETREKARVTKTERHFISAHYY